MNEDFEWDDYAATVDHDLAYEDDRDYDEDYDYESGGEDSYLDSSYEDRYDLGDY